MHVYCLHVINIKETFLQVFYQVSPLHNVLLWKCSQSHSAAYYSKVIVVSSVSTLNFAATQHAVNMKWRLGPGRGREDTRVQNANCRPWVPAQGWCRPGNRPTQKFTMQCPEKAPTKAFFLLKFRKAPLTALCCSLSAQRRNFINEYFQH